MSAPTASLLPAALAAALADDDALVAAGKLQAACKARLWDVAAERCRGVCLLLHGFTAGPWQFDELGPKLAASGIAAFAARLPGHGARAASALPDGQDDDASGFPTSRQATAFGTRAEEAYHQALALAEDRGVALTLVGHSAGGAMALHLLGASNTKVARAVLVAPLIRPKLRWDYVVVRALGRIPGLGGALDRIRLSWPTAAVRPDGWVRPGHRRFRLGHVVALFRYAGEVRRRAARAVRNAVALPPIQFICTAFDDKVDVRECRRLAEARPKRHYLLCFARGLRVPHALLTRWENPMDAHRARAHEVACAFLLDGRGTDETVSAP